MDSSSALAVAIKTRRLVQFVRKFESRGDHLIGVPIAVGRVWVVLARIDDRIAPGGFDALRQSDIAEVRDTFKGRTFYIRGLRARRSSVAALPNLDLDSTAGLLRSVSQFYSLLVLSCEGLSPDTVDIGVLLKASRESCSLRLISSNAQWVRGRSAYRNTDITRVGFGGEYEETLAAVARLSDPKWK